MEEEENKYDDDEEEEEKKKKQKLRNGDDDDNDTSRDDDRRKEKRRVGNEISRRVNSLLLRRLNQSHYDIDELLDGDYFNPRRRGLFYRSHLSSINSAARRRRRRRRVVVVVVEENSASCRTKRIPDGPRRFSATIRVPYCTWRLNDENDTAQNGGRDMLLVRIGAANSELSHENKQLMDQVMVSTIPRRQNAPIRSRLSNSPRSNRRPHRHARCGLTNPPP